MISTSEQKTKKSFLARGSWVTDWHPLSLALPHRWGRPAGIPQDQSGDCGVLSAAGPLYLNCEVQSGGVLPTRPSASLSFAPLAPPPLWTVRVSEWVSVLYNVWDGSLVVHRGMDNVSAFSKASEEHRQSHGGFLDSRPAPCHGPFSPLH